MKKILIAASVILLFSGISGCTFIHNLSTYRSDTETFTNALLAKDYKKCMSLMDFKKGDQVDMNAINTQLDTFRNVMIRNFGDKLEYSFIKAEKHISTNKTDNLSSDMTVAQIEFYNKQEIGVMQVIFDDKTGKIYDIKPEDFKQRIPDMSKFWLFFFLGLIVVALNIYTIVQVKRSSLKRKWLNYIAIVLFNVPTIGYNAVSGIYFKVFYFQILLGISFFKSGYLGADLYFVEAEYSTPRGVNAGNIGRTIWAELYGYHSCSSCGF
jgi:hypothetical protein